MTKERKVAVITGASRGLGHAMAERLAADGHFVVANYKSNASDAETLIGTIKAKGGDGITLQGDMSDVPAIDGFFTRLDEALVRNVGSNCFHSLVCNAGIIRTATVEHTSEDDVDALFDLNVKGVFFTIQKALPRMRTGGSIITLGSGLTRFSYPQYVAYAASKGAVDTMTQVLAKDLGAKGITVNMVAPGPVDTDLNADWLKAEPARVFIASQTALGRVATPADIIGAVSFLCGPDSRWITGQRLEASGGIHL
jgi:3-oxoacyl-[acyl-carrier protein] reductase